MNEGFAGGADNTRGLDVGWLYSPLKYFPSIAPEITSFTFVVLRGG